MIPALDRLTASLADRYQLERELGAGGMATVYLAQDLRHHRPVAVKVLRPELAAIIGAERFLAEIRTTANLQHPHILPLFDSGDADGFLFYVMPYVQGESLRDRLRRETQLPIAEAVRIAGEVASALDYAHRHGVIHRDIKPENILLHDGRALVADFGIALALTSAGTGTGSGGRMTETGMSLGTPHYMSPEQAMGEREITGRSDVYAMGAVLYEMLVGEPPFTGPSVQAIVAKVLTEQPRPLLPKRHTIPPHLEAVVLTALEKLPADRFAGAGDFLAALNDTTGSRVRMTSAMPAGVASRSGWRSHLAVPMTVAALLLGGIAAWLALRPKPDGVVQRYGLALPEPEQITGSFAISPDGRRLVYAGPGNQLWMKEHNRADAVPLPATVGARGFAFSPDGESIVYVEGGHVRKLPLTGGAAITLADSASPGAGIAWLDDGSVVFVRGVDRALKRVPSAGGAAETIFHDDTLPAILPRALPGSRMLLFTVCRGGICGVMQDLAVLDLRTRAARRIVPGAVSGTYLPTHHLIYVRRDGAMLAARFDPARGTLQGPAVPILDSVVMGGSGVVPLYAISATGTMVMRLGASSTAEQYELVSVDRAGNATATDPDWTFRMVVSGANVGWSLSPDGTRLAIGLSTDAGDDIWIKQLPRGPLSRLSFDSASEFRPRWMPDGRSVMFMSNRGQQTGVATGARLFRHSADGTGGDSLLLEIPRPVFEGAWTRDGKWLAIRTGGVVAQTGGRDIMALRPGVDSAPIPLMASAQFDESSIALSPDGRWIAYASDETGGSEVYVRPFPNVDGGKWQVSTRGGQAPLWAPNGREILYVNGDREMISVPVTAGAALQLGESRRLFQLNPNLYLSANDHYTPFDISPDGQRFVMARQVHAAAVMQPVIVVENWFQELKARMAK